MELEGRIETMENTLKILQDELHGIAAKKADVADVAQKVDLEQVGQCVQAIRHEVTDIVKRKASREFVESSVQNLQQELVDALLRKVDINQMQQQLHMELEQVQQPLQQELELVRNDIAGIGIENKLHMTDLLKALEGKVDNRQLREHLDGKVDVETLEQCLQDVRGSLDAVVSKTDFEHIEKRISVMHHDFTEASQLKVTDLERIDQSMLAMQQEYVEALHLKVDKDVTEQIAADQHELVHALQRKADMAYVETSLQAISHAVSNKADSKEVGQCVEIMQKTFRQEVMDTLSEKADAEQVEQLCRNQSSNAAQLGASVEDLSRRLVALSSDKADRDKVVEIVEAVREEMIESMKRHSATESEDVDRRVQAAVRTVADQVGSMADQRKVDQQLGLVRQELVDAVASKADIKLMTERLTAMQESLSEQVDRQVNGARQEFTSIVGRKADVEQLDQRVNAVQQEIAEVLEPRAAADQHASQVVESTPFSQIESWMEERMVLVKMELNKLVDRKADTVRVDHVQQEITHRVDQRVQAAQQEITHHVDQRVRAAQQELSEQVDERARTTRKELAELVNLAPEVTERARQIEQAAQEKQCFSTRDAKAASGFPNGDYTRQDADLYDGSERVRSLLNKLVQPGVNRETGLVKGGGYPPPK